MLKYIINLPIVKFSNKCLLSSLDRSSFDIKTKEAICQLNEDKLELPKISAVYRVKNGERTIESSILSVAPVCSEIIIVDNGSTDRTLDIVEGLKSKLSDVCSIKIFKFNNKVAIAGNNYTKDLTTGEMCSLSDFYNFAFSKGSGDYLMKVDSHLIFTFSGLKKIQKKLSKKPRFIMYRGVEIFGKSLSYEIYIYKNDGGFRYIDGEQYECLKFDEEPTLLERITNRIIEPIFIHVKRLSYVVIDVNNDLARELYK
ncbi:glycosyltransferase [Vibrio mimicus]|uniref:glycosyltransferase family 2 protein n=1 Tax=Vibrio mimicus TaxID=674 RepID=UPI002F95F0DA